MQHNVDVLVIGAGQAGLAMGYYLKQKNILFAIVGKENRIGDVWRNRYDSLVLFTPRWFSSLSGMALMGDQNGYPTKDEIADYLEDYAQKYELPVHLNTEVQRGVTSVKGLYFLGLPWQYRRGSALIGGVGDDAEYLINDILK